MMRCACQAVARRLPPLRQLLLLLCSVGLAWHLPQVTSIPTLLIDSGRPSCVHLEAPRDTVIYIMYEAPDIVLDENDPAYGPTYVTVSVQPHGRVFDTDLHSATVRDHLKPQSHMLEDHEGEFEHRFEMSGVAAICIRASMASAKNPMAFGLRVEEQIEMKASKQEAANVDVHLTHMERELGRIASAMDQVRHEAEQHKDQDQRFHDQTLAMHAATTYWPMVQVCVLLMTGFTQASHIVRFFKSRRII